jgi:hypothetical protein
LSNFEVHQFSFAGLVWLVFRAFIFALAEKARILVGVKAFIKLRRV